MGGLRALAEELYALAVAIGEAQELGYQSDGLDEEGLTRIADATGGRYFRATDTASLQQIYDTIDELEPSPAEVSELVQHVERYHWFLLPGVALLGLSLLLSSTWLRRGP